MATDWSAEVQPLVDLMSRATDGDADLAARAFVADTIGGRRDLAPNAAYWSISARTKVIDPDLVVSIAECNERWLDVRNGAGLIPWNRVRAQDTDGSAFYPLRRLGECFVLATVLRLEISSRTERDLLVPFEIVTRSQEARADRRRS